jgi:hypothetical protein
MLHSRPRDIPRRRFVSGQLYSISHQATKQAKGLWSVIREKHRAAVTKQRTRAKFLRKHQRKFIKVHRRLRRDSPKIVRVPIMRVDVMDVRARGPFLEWKPASRLI